MNIREYFYERFETGDIPTQEEWIELFLSLPFLVSETANLPEPNQQRSGQIYVKDGTFYKCEDVDSVWTWVDKTGVPGGGTTNYGDLNDKPKINNVLVSGARTLSYYGIMPDFKNLNVVGAFSDEMILAVGNLKNEISFAHITDFAKYLSNYMQSVGSVKVPFVIEGTQDGNNLTFTTVDKYYLNTSSLYLNGQRMIPTIDYDEVDENTFAFKEEAPVTEDRLFFEAIKK